MNISIPSKKKEQIMSEKQKMYSFSVYAKVRTNVLKHKLCYDLKIHNRNGSTILFLKKQPLGLNGMIGPHETRKIPINSANSYIKEVMLYKLIGGNAIPVRKQPYIIPYPLENFKGNTINPKLLETTLDYFESEGVHKKNKVVTVAIAKKECRYVEFINNPFKIFKLKYAMVENVGINATMIINGEISVHDGKVFVYAEGTTNAALPTTGDGTLHFLGKATLYDGDNILKQETFKERQYMREAPKEESNWFTRPRYNPNSPHKIIGDVDISLPKPSCRSNIKLKVEFFYQVERPGSGSFTSGTQPAEKIFQLRTVTK